MKLSKISAATLAATVALTLSACSNDDKDDEAEPTTSAAPSSSAAAIEPPTLEELNAVLARAIDPNLPIEEKTQTVQGGENAPELFDVMAESQRESGAKVTVVDPILPGYTPNSYLANATFERPDSEPQVAEGVEFVFEDDVWKVSEGWACTLVVNTVPPEQVPPMCQDQIPAPPEGEEPPAPAPEGEEAPAPAPEGAQPPAEAPAPAPAEGELPPPPAEGAPAPAPAE